MDVIFEATEIRSPCRKRNINTNSNVSKSLSIDRSMTPRFVNFSVMFALVFLSLLINASSVRSSSSSQLASAKATTLRGGEETIAPKGNAYPVAVGESALVDKETGRIYWQSGGPAITTASILGGELKHLKASALSATIFTSLFTMLLVRRVWEGLLGPLPAQRPTWMTAILLFLLKPRLTFFTCNPWFLAFAYILYLMESYYCSTRRYLGNMCSLEEVESQIEAMRSAKPSVVWTVRCFHYEKKRWKFGAKTDDGDADEEGDASSLLSKSGKKVITHRATKQLNITSWHDNTMIGLWRRASGFMPAASPFTKISFSKVLALSNAKARDDYFAQQAAFISSEGRKDDHAEFSTSIKVEGYKPKMLAARATVGSVSIHLFWLSTLLGLTVPYRIWFSRHCDELRVTIVKDVCTNPTPQSSWLSSSLNPRGWISRSVSVDFQNKTEYFRRKMLEFELYREEIHVHTSTNSTTAQNKEHNLDESNNTSSSQEDTHDFARGDSISFVENRTKITDGADIQAAPNATKSEAEESLTKDADRSSRRKQ